MCAFLLLLTTLALTASPALGQFQPAVPQWSEPGNSSNRTRLGLMSGVDRDVPQNDAEGVRWKPVLFGAGTGFTLGFAYGLVLDANASEDLGCIQRISDPTGRCLNNDRRPYEFRITLSLVGLGLGLPSSHK